MVTLEKIKEQIQELSGAEREQLLDWIVGGEKKGDPKEVEAAWLDLAEKRSAEIHSGKVAAIPAAEVHRELKAKYGLGG